MSEAELFFIGESIRHALTLSLPDAVKFLEGLLGSLSEHHPARPRLVIARNDLVDADAQLELIATGQLKMEELLRP
ncbi:MAG TPA: hypothetical protein VK474_09030 [Chthoniobacterales bacterium]|nr:hypothetical protein [Chthoniobacterales bacterium]